LVATETFAVRAHIAIKQGRMVLDSDIALRASLHATQNGRKLRKVSAQLILAQVKEKLVDQHNLSIFNELGTRKLVGIDWCFEPSRRSQIYLS